MNLSIGYRDDEVAPSVSINGITGEQAESLTIEQEENNSYYINDTVGAVGDAYHFEMNGTFENTATISFEFDSDLLNDEDFDPVIYYFNEEEQELEALQTTIVGNKASAQVEHFSIYILTNRTEYLGSFTWYDTFERTNYSNIKSVFVISDCETLGSGVNGQNIDTTYRRLDYARQIAASLPSNSLTTVIKYGDYPFSYEEGLYTPDHVPFLINFMNFKTNITDNQSSSPDNVVRFAINHYLSDTTDNCMKIVFLITDGKANYDIHQFTLDAISQKNVRVFTVDIGSNTQAKKEYLKHFAEVSNGYYCDATQPSGIQKLIDQMQLYYSFGTDSDSDGIPDDYEDSLILFNGKSIVTDKNDSDTDDDNLSDGEEVRLEVKYSPDGNRATVVGHLISDPTEMDSDMDGITDDNDSLPFKKGIYGGFVGELSIVSSNGHSFLLYKSFVDDILDLNGLSNIYGRGITGDIIQLSNKNYHIKPEHYITVGASSDSASDAYFNSYYDLIVTTYNNTSPMTKGGIKCNWEINNYYYNSDDNQLPNSSLTVFINEIQLQSLIDYWNTDSYYSVLNHNCTTIAIYSWYRVSPIRFLIDICLPIDLKQQIEFMGGNEIYLSDILPYVE